MTQQIINLGSGPDTQTGDSLYTAFTKVNDNFTELYSVFDGNGISNINANVIISNNVVVSSNVRTGNIAAYGNIETIGYVITAGAFYPNGVPIGSLGAIGGNVLPLTTNLYTIGNNSLQFTEGYFSTNITIAGANVTVRDGTLFVNGQIASGNYGNSNVAAYLPVYGGNIDATLITASQPYITQTGTLVNLTAETARVYGNLVVEGNLSVDGNVTFFNVDNLLVEDPIITLNTGANGSPLTFDNGFDSGIKSYYYDTENREAFFGRKDDTGYFEYYSNVISEVGNIVSGTYGTIKTGNLLLTEQANVTGNVTANYFLGNGRFLDGIDTTLISNGNSNVQVYQNGNIAISSGGIANVAEFTTIGGNITGDFYITGTIKALNYIGNVQGNLSAPGANTQVIFNDNSTAGATSGFTFDKSTNTVVIAGGLSAGGQAYLSNLSILGNTIYVVNSGDDIVLQPDGVANVYIGSPGQNNQLVVSGNINTPANIVVNNFVIIDSNGNIVTSRLQDSGVTAGTYGNASAVPVITVDEKGRVTNVSTTAVAGVSNLTYDNTTSNLTISTSAGTEFTVDLGVGSEDSPVFANTTITGNLFAESANANTIITDGTAYLYNISSTGLATLTSVNVLGSVDVTGNLATNNLIIDSFISGNLVPDANVAYNLGTSSARWKDLYLSGSSIYLGDIVLSTNTAGLTVSGNITANNIVANGAGTFDTILEAFAGLQNTVIGNVQPSNAFFTSIDVNGGAAVQSIAVNANAQIGGRLTANGGIQNTLIGNELTSSGAFTAVTAHIVGNVGTTFFGNTYTAYDGFNGPLNGTLGQAGGNTAIISELSVTGNATINTVIANTSVNTPVIISNVVLAQDINANGYVTVDAITVNTYASFNNGITATGNINANNIFSNGIINAQDTISAAAGIQNTVIGNVVSRSGFFRNLTANGTALINALNVNANATVGTTLDVTGNTEVGNLRTAGTILITNTINSTGANTGALVVQGGASFEKDVYVLGNVYTTNLVAVNANTLSVQDPLLYLTANTPYPYNYDIGFFSQFQTGVSSGYQHTGFVRDVDDGTWKLFSNVVPDPTTTVSFDDAVYDNLLTGTHTVLGQIIGNSTLSVYGNATVGNLFANNNISAQNLNVSGLEVVGNVTVGELTVTNSAIITGTLQAPGGLQNTIIGNVNPNSAYFTVLDVSGNTIVGNLSVNGESTFSSNIAVVGNATAGNVITSSIFVANIISDIITLDSQTDILARGNLIPIAGNVYALGNTSSYWSDIFANSIIVGNTISSGSNINASGLSISGSGTFTSTLHASEGLQNTIIGNITPSSAYFTDVDISANLTVNDISVNNNVTISNTLAVLGNITAPYFIGDIFGNITGNVAAPGSNRQVMFNDNGIISADSGLVYNKDVDTLTINGNLSVDWVIASGGAEFKEQVVVDAGLQNTVIGNVIPASATFTTESVSGNSTVNSLTVNNSATIGSGLGVIGNITVSNGNIFAPRFNSTSTQLSAPIPGSDAGFRTTLYDFNTTNQVNYGIGVESNHIWNAVDNNIEQLGFKWYGNTVQIARLSGSGNLVIANNLTASSASFGNSVVIYSNLTAGNVTSNGSITAQTTLSALGGIQATPIGNITPSTAQFTSVNASANVTVNQLTVNSTTTIGGTLGVTGAMVVAALDVAGHANVGHLQIDGNITGNIIPSANGIYNIGSTDFRYKDLYLSGNTLYLGDVVLSSDENNFIIAGNLISGNVFSPIIGNIGTDFVGESLSLSANIVANGLTINTSISAGETISAAGGLQATPIGNTVPSTAQFTTVDTSGNIVASALTVNNSITVGSTLSVDGGIQNTAIGNVTPSSAQFTTLNSSGNTTVDAVTVNASATIGTTLSALGGLQATPIGNITPSSAQFTTLSSSGNATVDAISINNSVTIGTTLSALGAAIVSGGLQATAIGNVTPSSAIFTTQSISGNSTVNGLTVNTSAVVNNSLQVSGGIQNSPIGNVTPSSAQFTTINASGNITGAALTANGSVTAGTTLSAAGGIQNTPIGNVSPNSAQFTTVNTSGNLTAANISINSSVTAGTTLSAAGGLQATPIGNVVPSTAQFTSVNASGLTTVNSLVSNTSIQTASLDASANVVVNALSVNNSVTIGDTLGVAANITGTNISLSGSQTITGLLSAAGGLQATPIGNATASTGAFTAITGDTLTITGNTILGNLDVLGTVTYINSEITTLKDPIIELNTGPNGAPLSSSAPYDSGLKTHYWDGVADRSAFFGRSNSSGYFEFYSNVTNETANVITGTLGTIRSGNLELTGVATIDDTLTVGANAIVNGLTVNTSSVISQTLEVQGGIQNTVIGNVTPSSAQFTTISVSGNVIAQDIQVNASVIAAGNVSAPYFIGNIIGNITGNISAAGANTEILFNDNSLVGASNQFTFNKSNNLLTVGGNINASGLTVTGSGTFTSTVSSDGGIQNTVIGNITPAGALFTTVNINSNATVNALSINNTATIGSTLGVVGNINGTSQTLSGSQTVAGSISAAGGLQATPIGNSAASSGQFTTVSATGNITAAALTANGSLTTGTTLTAAGGLQATPIGNLVPDTAQFTTLNSSGNATVNALTVNTSAVIGTTLSVQGGIQDTAIGNVTASTGKFTTLETTSTATVNELISNGSVTGTTAQFTSIDGSANATVNALSVNTSAVIGTTLQAQGGLQDTPIGNSVPNSAQFTSLSASGNVTVADLSVNNTVTVGSTLGVSGALTVSNVDASTSNVTGAIKVSGGIGVGGNLYVGNRVGWVAPNSVSAVYQIYNPSTSSLDTIFE